MDHLGWSAEYIGVFGPDGNRDGPKSRWLRLVLHGVLIALCTSFFPPLLAADSIFPNSRFSAALWVAQHRKLSKYGIRTGSELLGVGRTYQTLSIDSDHHTVWAAREDGMDLRGFDGHIIAQASFRLQKQHTVLSSTDEHGRIWLGAGSDLAHFDKDGTLLGRTSVRRNILAIDIDAAHEHFWVATHKDIDVFDSEGQHLENVTPGPISDIKAFEYDPFLNALWVSATTRRNRHDLPAEEHRSGKYEPHDGLYDDERKQREHSENRREGRAKEHGHDSRDLPNWQEEEDRRRGRQEGEADSHDSQRTKVNPAPFAVSATPSSGMAPLEVAFAVNRETAAMSGTSDDTIYVVDYDFDGDGTVDLSRSSFTLDGGSIVFEPADLTEPVTHHYETPGTYVAKVTINDLHNVDPRLASPGDTFMIPIEVGGASRMDQMFRDIWKELLDSLADKDVQGALALFSPSARPKFEPIFTALMPQIDQIVPNLGELVQGELIGDDLAVYYLRRGNRGFPIQFVRGLDGVWRIAEM